MYEKFYGLSEKPFNVTPDPRFLYLGEHHQEALAHLIYGISERKGFIVLTGEVGVGKTTLLHTLLERLDENVATALIFNPMLDLKDFFLTLFDEFDLKAKEPTKAHFLMELNNFLIERLKRDENTVLIVDEAQNLDPSILEEIRLLLNLETPREKLLQIVLAGQPELSRKLNLPELRQLKQRISVRYHIPPLGSKEGEAYIKERLKFAGNWKADLFTKKAIDRILKYSQGIPRRINILCDSSLLVGYALDQSIIDEGIIKDCVADLESSGQSLKHGNDFDLNAFQNFFRLRRIRLAFLVIFLFFVLVVAGSLGRDPGKWRQIWTRLSGFDSGYSITEIEKINEEPDQRRLDSTPPATDSIGEEAVPSSNPAGIKESRRKRDKPTVSVVTVKKDDRLSKIVLEKYGRIDARILSLVKEANPMIKDVNYIEVGWQIILPELFREDPADDSFTVHIASFDNIVDAKDLFFRLANEGYEVYLMPVNIPNKGHWHRVTLGRFHNKKEAVQYADNLIEAHKFQYVQPLPIARSEAVEIEN